MPRYGHKSDPHTHADEILMTASVGLTIFGTSRSSKRTSRGPYKTAPRMIHLLISISLCSDVSVRCTHHLPRVPRSEERRVGKEWRDRWSREHGKKIKIRKR